MHNNVKYFSNLKTNKELSDIFGTMSDCYKYLGPADRFRASAYENISKMLGNMKEPIEDYDHEIKNLDKLKGIGESIAEKIVEYIDTGKIKTFEELKNKVPIDLFGLMDTEGIGPGTIRMIHDKLHVSKKSDLVEKIKKNDLIGLKGVGPKKIELLKKGLDIYEEKKRIQLKVASVIANEMLTRMKAIKGIDICMIAGSIRRKKETIGDIDIIVATDDLKKKKIIDAIIKLELVKRVINKGNTKLSLILKKEDLQCDIRLVSKNQFGSALLYLTGSKEHNIILRSIARKKGMKLNEYGLFEIETNKHLGGQSEKDIYDLMGLEFVQPEKRIGKDEFKQIK